MSKISSQPPPRLLIFHLAATRTSHVKPTRTHAIRETGRPEGSRRGSGLAFCSLQRPRFPLARNAQRPPIRTRPHAATCIARPAAHVTPAAQARLSCRLLAPPHRGGGPPRPAPQACRVLRSAPCAGHHPARSGLRPKIGRRRWRPSRPPCRAHPPSATLRMDEPAPL